MSKSVAVPDKLYNKAAELAAKEQVSVEEFVSAAVANRLASREYIESRARLFNLDPAHSLLVGMRRRPVLSGRGLIFGGLSLTSLLVR